MRSIIIYKDVDLRDRRIMENPSLVNPTFRKDLKLPETLMMRL